MSVSNIGTIDVERIKSYNNSLKTYKEKGAKLLAEAEFTEKELIKLCQELTQELGVQVTVENIEQIYAQRVAKIEDTLRTGEEILNRIKSEEGMVNTVVMPNTAEPRVEIPVVHTENNPAQYAQPINIGVAQTIPGINNPPAPEINTQQVNNINGQSNFAGNQQMGTLPNMFGSGPIQI